MGSCKYIVHADALVPASLIVEVSARSKAEAQRKGEERMRAGGAGVVMLAVYGTAKQITSMTVAKRRRIGARRCGG